MINQFRNLNPINLLILFAYTFFMRMAIFADLPAQLHFEFLEPYTKFFIQIPIARASFLLQEMFLLQGLMIYVQAILFNRVINNHGLLSKAKFFTCAAVYHRGQFIYALPDSESYA